MGWVFIFGCLLNLVIIVSSGSKKSERKQLSSGKALQQKGWGSTTGRSAFCFLPEHPRPTLRNERAWQNPGEVPTVSQELSMAADTLKCTRVVGCVPWET